MLIEETSLPEIKLITRERYFDERGFFGETYRESEYEVLNIPRFVQENLSESSKGVIRGLHWQTAPYAQGKLVSCLVGEILDVAIDIRKDSPNYGKHVAIELNGDDLKALWIPEGFAHGFQALQDGTRVQYKTTNYWHKESERSVNPLDEQLGIEWPFASKIISQKDLEAPEFYSL